MISIIQVSLYGTNREEYLKTTGTDLFEQFIEGITLMKDAGINYTLSYSLETCTEKEIRSVFEFAKKFGAEAVRIGLLFQAGRNKNDIYANKNLESVFEIVKTISQEYEDIALIENSGEKGLIHELSEKTPFLNSHGKPSCGGFTTRLTVNQDGLLKPCTSLPDCCGLSPEKLDDLIQGNLPDKSFFDIPMVDSSCAIAQMLHKNRIHV